MKSMQSILEIRTTNNETYSNELYHYGVKGQKWGFRQYQDSGGSLTPLGRIHYGVGEARNSLSSVARNMISDYSNVKIDTLDVLNRKGVLDFLDSKADAPFSAVREGLGKAGMYKSESSKDVFRAFSNLDRYLDISGATKDAGYDWVRKSDSPIVKKSMDLESRVLRRDQASKAYSQLLDSYSKDNLSGVVKGLMKKEGQSAADKKIGMMSRDARDIEREVNAKSFLDSLKTDKQWDISKLSREWYRTDDLGHKKTYEEATGKSGAIYEDKTVVSPKYTKVVTPGKEVASEIRWKKLGDWDTSPGHYDIHNNLIPWDSNGEAVERSVTRIPEKTTWIQDGVKKEKATMLVGYTKDFQDYMATMEMPKDYSHLLSGYKSSTSAGSDWLKEFMHSDISNELYHHGTKGQKWGIRQYQNSDGSLTPLGRIHYGVGEAKKGLGKAASVAKTGASKIGNSVRRKVKPTNEELVEDYNNAREKQARRKLKEDIKEAEGKTKHKKLKDMSDDEVLDYMRRLQNERSIRQMEKEANQSAISRIFEDYAKQGITRATNNVIDKAIENLFKEKEKVKYSDVLKETEAKLKLDVLDGDQDAAKRLKDLKDASKK